MAGWSMIAGDRCALDSSKTPQKELHQEGFLDGLDPFSQLSRLTTDSDAKLRCQFDNCLKSLRKEICVLDSAFPPMLGDGQPVDLLKLFLLVREKGGYDVVSKNGLWSVVAQESGLGLNIASSVKLVYAKYLDTLEKCLERVVDDKNSKTKSSVSSPNVGGISMELRSEFKGLLSDIPEWKSVLNVSAEVDPNGDEKCIVDDEESVHIGTGKSGVDFVDVGKLGYNVAKSSAIDSFSDGDKKCKDDQENLRSNLTSLNAFDEDEVKSMVVEIEDDKKCENGDENDVIVLDSDAVKDSFSCLKRKRKSVCRVLNWITGVARNPCDPLVDSLPESSKWGSYGNEELWKQVLLAREALFLKGNVDSGAEQKNRKMHPCMYDDPVGSAYNFRERLKCTKKLLHGKTASQGEACSQLSSSTAETESDSCTKKICDGHSSTKYSVIDIPVEKPIPLGPDFQAEVPEWTGMVSQSDSKWVGTRVWPPEKIDNRLVIEREPIGKGRQDSCGCEVPKSTECVRFHSTEKRMRTRRELGIAFLHWKFDKMGEDVKLSWTEEEEKKFKAIVRLNPPSLDKCFWDEMFKFFPTRRREDLVSYYFNVFLLQRRAHQNRFTPNNIDSDDDESECGLIANSSGHEAPKSPGSLLYSAKKPRKNAR
ncbi:AT-rich interactive domain-containing protein 1 isoform X2 [Jatropha curcas]|nr:AT-rich interactive domain-containing protein 1 isoform X2 [Jatropha curcas]